ncbi:type VII secretion protein EccE [Rhodococcoides corynebacterioides]|uniref:Type VII secretion system protein EccE domain-containing protein n=1 Tax=Rhodococcoides corynebacterioides TaxID=53972 RepID=A0ABS7P007_9NOCA|nr:type VII secretion protein EccE [Rhodococcus corynebacterioides]MBY6365714.1 hypothetical protein [Rhodococcus corynebacterioides]MBY6406445.1 hypothetical protein [Rhodococcus corynebacterioides]
MLRAQYIGSPAAADASDAADPRPGEHRRVSTAVAGGTVVALVAAALGAPVGWAVVIAVALGAAVLLAAAVAPSWSPWARWIRSAPRGRWAPAHARTRSTTTVSVDIAGRPTALVWDGATAAVVAELTPTRSEGWSILDGQSVEPDLSVPVRALLARAADGDEAPIDVVVDSVVRRPRHPGRPHATVLPMTSAAGAAAVRSTYLTMVLDVVHAAPAIARRGGGAAGLAAVLDLHLQRLVHVAAAHAVLLRPLDVDALDAARNDADPGLWHALPTGRRTVAATRSAIGTADAVSWWLTSAGSTTRGHLSVATDRQLRGMIGVRPDRRRAGENGPGYRRRPDRLLPVAAADPELLAVPLAGCGQLIGVRDDGRGVAVRLWGPGVRHVAVDAEAFVVFQLVWRAVATGARVVVATDRPAVWQQPVAAAADPSALTLAAPHHPIDPRVDLLVHDHPGPRRPNGHACVFTTAGDDDTADVAVVQQGSSDRVLCRVGSRSTTVRLVSTAAETDAIGRPRGRSAW